MAKNKKKVIVTPNLATSFGFESDDNDVIDQAGKEDAISDNNKSSIQDVYQTEDGKLAPDILLKRFKNRKIPKVDEGFGRKGSDLSNDALQKFYKECRIKERVKSVNGGKYIHFDFGSMLKGYDTYTDDQGENDIIKKLSYAEITKKSFINNMNVTIRYINYFIHYFDDDDELMHAYFIFMLQLHFDRVDMSLEAFVSMIYSIIATPSMVDKVIRMVEYNTDESLIKKTDRTYDESIQLTVEHLKAIMGVSIFARFIIPIVSHYYSVRRKEVDAAGFTDKDLYYTVFESFFTLFDDYYDISLYEKLYHTARTRISKTENREVLMWKRRERFGKTPTSFTNELMRDFLCDILQKVVFNQSAIIFLHVCFDRAIKNELIQPDKHEMSDMKMEASDAANETISRFDRWQMDRTQHSERDRIRAYVSIKDMVWYLGAEQGIRFLKVPDAWNPGQVSPDKDIQEEYEFYLQNIKKPLSDTQLYLIQLYCSKALGAAEDVKMMEFEDIIKVIMIMKRDLRNRNYAYIPFFISSTLETTGHRRHNIKNLDKQFKACALYPDWVSQFPDTLEQINMPKFYGELSTCISCPITIVEYESELHGKVTVPNDLPIIDEWIRFMCEL